MTMCTNTTTPVSTFALSPADTAVITGPSASAISAAAGPQAVQKCDQELDDVLKALAGWSCSLCSAPLRPGANLVCCDRCHCSYCGGAFCEHWVARKRGGPLRLKGLLVLGQLTLPRGIGASGQPKEAAGLTVVRNWSVKQRQAVFGTAAGLLEAVFGEDLSAADGWDTNRVKQVLLEQVLQPDRHVRYRIASRHYHQAWFCRDGVEATARAAQALVDLRAGVKKLRDRERARERRQKIRERIQEQQATSVS